MSKKLNSNIKILIFLVKFFFFFKLMIINVKKLVIFKFKMFIFAIIITQFNEI
jgi:hypothetical protein